MRPEDESRVHLRGEVPELYFCEDLVVMDDQSDPRIAADVGHPPAIAVSVESDVVLAERVVDDDLPRGTVRPECGQHRAPRRRKESTHRTDQTPAVGHDQETNRRPRMFSSL